MSLAGKVVLVTGGASGMGRICALRAARQGAKVAIFDMNEEGMAATVAESTNISAWRCDVSSWDDVRARVAEVAQALGPVDRLVHAAAIMPSYSVANHTVEATARLMAINFNGTVHLVQALLPAMLARDSGEMVLFGSVAGWALVPKMGVYCASKAAVNAYVEVLQNEIARTGVKVHLVCPPAVNTPLVDQTIATETPGSILQAKKSGRLADPEKIVDAIDKGVARGKAVIFPGEAKLLYLWHALLPRLWWKAVMQFER